MKIDSIKFINNNSLPFKGYSTIKDSNGFKDYVFNYPFDEDKYDCYLELYNAKKDKYGNYIINGKLFNTDTDDGLLKLKNGENKINITSSYFLSSNEPFAYRYKLVNKKSDEITYALDSGELTQDDKNRQYNLITKEALNRRGAMKLVSADNFNVGYIYNKDLFSKENIIKDTTILNKAVNSYKNFSNKIGGTLAGLEKSVEDGEFDGYSNIVSLPLFTDDSLTSHAYWNKNCMQIAQSLGNINNYASLQRNLFKKGINLVSDGAFINEGLEGIHFANVLKWGEDSPFLNWFNFSELKSGPIYLGVFSKNTDFISHKIINSPYKYTQLPNGTVKISKNHNYDKHKPTFVQIFDKRLTSKEQSLDNENLIDSYDNLNTPNPYDINTHYDTIVSYHFEINPEEYNINMIHLNEYNKAHKDKIKIDDMSGTKYLNKFKYFYLEDKIENGFETWDANPDIAKLHYVTSHAITENTKNLTAKQKERRLELLERNYNEVQDYIITSSKFWTQKTKDILTLYTAQNLKNIDSKNPEKTYKEILEKIDSGILPQKLKSVLTKDIVENILNDKYVLTNNFSNETFEEQVKKGLMDYPLDAIEFGDNIVSTLAMPYITKRATHKDEIGMSKYELYKKGNPHVIDKYKKGYEQTQKIYEKEMLDFAEDILKRVQNKLPEKLSDGSQVTIYGQYVLPIITGEIAKFAVIKALKPDAEVFIDNETGEIGYNYKELKDFSLQGLGINGLSPEDEALSLIHKIRTGIKNIGENDKKLLINAIYKSLSGTDVNSFKLTDMIIDRTQSGLDWRIDAAKDIADVDALRNDNTDFDYTWENIINFWQRFNENILEINPNAYLVAEVTDEHDLHYRGNGQYSKRFNKNDIIRKFLRETKMTSTANYSSYFTDIAKIYGKSFENGSELDIKNLPNFIYEKMIGYENYLQSANLEALLSSYTFIDNHDKPRALHCLGFDMGMFYADLTKNTQYQERAYRLLNDKFFGDIKPEEIKNYDFTHASAKAVAAGEAYRTAFIRTLDDLSKENKTFKQKHEEIFIAISKAISDLANGRYFDKNFDADAFAVKPFDVVINTILKQARYKYNLSLNDTEMKQYSDKVFETMLTPAMSKFLGIMKYLVALPGKPTLYAGDDLGATGYEEKTKNIYLQNRSYIHNEWLTQPGKEFIAKYYQELKEIMALRSRPELDALNNGAPFTLRLQYTDEGMPVSALLRQNPDGKMAISLFNTYGINHNPDKYYMPEKIYLDKIDLTEIKDTNNIGLKGGLKEGTKFINANDKNDVYYVHKYSDSEGEHYILKHPDGSKICINDSTMILYHVPEKSQITFTGKISYIPNAKFISKAYGLNTESKMD